MNLLYISLVPSALPYLKIDFSLTTVYSEHNFLQFAPSLSCCGRNIIKFVINETRNRKLLISLNMAK